MFKTELDKIKNQLHDCSFYSLNTICSYSIDITFVIGIYNGEELFINKIMDTSPFGFCGYHSCFLHHAILAFYKNFFKI